MTNERDSINDLIKSLTRFSWALSLLGANQIANAFRPGRQAATGFDAITRAAEEQFDETIQAAFQAGNQLQSGMVDLACDALTFEAFAPRRALQLTLDMMQQSADVFRLLTPGEEGRIAWQEFRNKLRAFTLFKYVDGLLLPAEQGSLTKMVERAASLEPFRSVWAMEGVGHYYAESIWARNETPLRLLTGDHAKTLPDRSLIPLHAGMGLSLAGRALAAIGPEGDAGEMRQALLWFIALCQSNAREGYAGAAYEALGLVARNLYPQMVNGINRQLIELDEELAGYFWHGVGRALYFAPTNFAPCFGSGLRAVAAARQEPPHALGRRNATAGLVWAITLVNICQPQVLEIFLRRLSRHGQCEMDGEAFANGVSSAVMVWRDAAPDDPGLHDFCRYQPPASDPAMAARWNHLVTEPCAQALRHYDAIKARGGFGELFRYPLMRQAMRQVSR